MKPWIAVIAAAVWAATVTAVDAQAPRKGGTLRLTAPYGTPLDILDIHASPHAQDGMLAHVIHRSLYKWDAVAGRPVLDLAKEVAASGGGLVYTYKLRDDVYFHNGRKMTAEDIIFSFTRIMDGSKGFPGAPYIRVIRGAADFEKGQAPDISGLKKVDDFTLQITLAEKVNPGFQFLMPTTAILPKEEVEKPGFATHPVGLGPFKFAGNAGNRITTEVFDKFFIAGRPYLDKVTIVPMADAAARDRAFRNKEIDLELLGSDQYAAYRDDPELSKTLIEAPETFTRAMGFNRSVKPFADKRVRQAINQAIDSDLIIKQVLKDKAYRAVSWLPLSSPAFDKTRKPYAFDPAKAKKLLADAGYPDGFEFELTTTDNDSWGLPVVEAMIPMLANVGIKVKVRRVEMSTLSEIVTSGDFQAFISSNRSGPDTLAALKCFYSKTLPAACNKTRFANPDFDKLLDAATAEEDPAKAIDLMKRADGVLFDEAPVWFFSINKAVMAVQPWVKGVQPNIVEMTWQQGEDLWVTEASPAAK